ncbi:NUT2 [Candida oxycetoniae]|uniref:Mediator of RNA polymerase II transcription subunit 10 n=1 Tax=Candida oxycetoniae TaxID=497107 RepID=A0AAI9SVV7_9ASCO|nr:NUT2 [Candida oxycetoniae]KAI3404053.1 NUT2 [Candida oxycetoniae]
MEVMTATIVPNGSNAPLIQLLDQVSNLIESFIELGILVHDNQGTQQSNFALTNKMQTLAKQLKQISNTDEQLLKDYLIPVDVITYIEDGRNPDIYTREFVEVSAKLNARLKGKMRGFGQLRNVLSEKLIKEFPTLESAVEDVGKRCELK